MECKYIINNKKICETLLNIFVKNKQHDHLLFNVKTDIKFCILIKIIKSKNFP